MALNADPVDRRASPWTILNLTVYSAGLMTRSQRPQIPGVAFPSRNLQQYAAKAHMRPIGPLSLLTALAIMTIHASFPDLAAAADPRAIEYKLDNGMQVVVIPDHRAAVVQHMVWYKVGASDETRGKSGIAHFLEHLMFKGTERIGPGQFSKTVARNGGQDNAFTGNDSTTYFQSVAKDRLPLVMEMESDRMANLKLAEQDVATELKVAGRERSRRTAWGTDERHAVPEPSLPYADHRLVP